MSEYKVIVKEVSNIVWRDGDKAGLELASDVNAALASGWEPQGGIASIQAGTGCTSFRRCTGAGDTGELRVDLSP